MKINLWGKWLLLKDGRIRRCRRLSGALKWESYPANLYNQLSAADKILLINRLNANSIAAEKESTALQKLKYDLAYFNEQTFKNFEEDLRRTATEESYIRFQRRYIDLHVLPFFIGKKNTPDPKNWKKLESEWSQWLRQKRLSADYILKIANSINRYLLLLKNYYSTEDFPSIELHPIETAVVKHLKSQETKIGKYISDDDWKKIEKEINPKIKSVIQIGYYYGLRRSETLAIDLKSIRKDYLSVEKQIVSFEKNIFKGLKNKEKRHTPHWFLAPEIAYEIITKLNKMNPDTLSKHFENEMRRLHMSYHIHDLRRTFITRALKQHHYLDVMRAVGHSNLKTTLLYLQDDRNLDSDIFVPEAK